MTAGSGETCRFWSVAERLSSEVTRPSPSASSASEPTVTREPLSWVEICARYPDEWVILIDVRYAGGDEDSGEIESAVVLTRSKARGDCIRSARPILDAEGIMESAHLFTGKMAAPPLFWRLQ